ncbi:MAG TPA: hypothetical protein P5144_12740 [Thermoanaerobaculia bacterium]|nr:hypothetical protein [Thermoanaerobaculia bacterium]
MPLTMQAETVPWPSPRACDGDHPPMGKGKCGLAKSAKTAGWPTPQGMDHLPPMDYGRRLQHPSRPGRTVSGNLREVATLSSWPTPQCADINASRVPDPQAYSRRELCREASGSSLAHTAQAHAPMAGWPTPRDTNHHGPDACQRQGAPTLQTMALAAPWMTPSSVDGEGGIMPWRPDLPKGLHYRLRDQSQLASWVTPAARDHKDSPGQRTARDRPDQLPRQAHSLLSSWLTPSASDDAAGNPGASVQPMLGSQAKLATSGAARSRTSASTARRGVLNPAFSRWLMSFPAEWDVAALLAARSMLPRRRARPGKPQGVALVSVSRPAGIRPLSPRPTRTRRARRA